jgi:hypothetical protein
MKDEHLYHEKLSSTRTTALFQGLGSFFLLLYISRMKVTGLYDLAVDVLLFLCILLVLHGKLQSVHHPDHFNSLDPQLWDLHLARVAG